MDWLAAHTEVITAGISALGSAWAAIRFIDRRIKSHLGEFFASKTDVAKIETKIDFLTEALLTEKVTKLRGPRHSKRDS